MAPGSSARLDETRSHIVPIRTLSNTFAGIAPASVSGFVALQVVGGAVGLAAALLLYPNTPELAVDLTTPATAQEPV